MELVASTSDGSGRRVLVFRGPDGLFTYRIEPGPAGDGIYDSADRAMAEALASPEWLDPFLGMTTNERLAAAGLLELFDDAIGGGDREHAVRLLTKTNISLDAAGQIVDETLRRRT
jgi:hypothetical protein